MSGITLTQWLEIIDANLSITGSLYSPTNTFINVSIKQNGGGYATLTIVDKGSSLYGRSNGDMDTPPTLYEAVENLLSQIAGKRVTFEGNGEFVVPEINTTGLAEKL